MSAKHVKLFCALLVAAFLFFNLRPAPNTEFLYRNFPELRDYSKNLKGSSTALFLDPSFFYKFSANQQDLETIVLQLELEPVAENQRDYYQEQIFGRNKPMPWHSWWWQPKIEVDTLLFSGFRNGNQLYLLYSVRANVIYLYVQNT